MQCTFLGRSANQACPSAHKASAPLPNHFSTASQDLSGARRQACGLNVEGRVSNISSRMARRASIWTTSAMRLTFHTLATWRHETKAGFRPRRAGRHWQSVVVFRRSWPPQPSAEEVMGTSPAFWPAASREAKRPARAFGTGPCLAHGGPSTSSREVPSAGAFQLQLRNESLA